jgi:hypothetical protein
MSKQLIEQLAKEHGYVNKWPSPNHTGSTYSVQFSSNQLEAFAKACQAEALEKAAKICDDIAEESNIKHGLTKDSYYEGARDFCDNASQEIRALIPTQANRTEG